MKAVVIHQAGGPEQLKLEEVPLPSAQTGWSVVKIKGFGINHSEIFTRRGLSPTVNFPRILGIECVGVISATSDPQRLPVGQKVVSIMGEMGRAFDGSYAEYVRLPNEQIYPVHTKLDWVTLATIPETYYTAYGSLLNLRIKAGQRILVRGGSSGVGVAFTQLAKALFADVTIDGTTRKMSKAAQLLAVGYNNVIQDRAGVLKTANSYDRVLELIGPATIKETFSHVRAGGIVCSTGELGNEWYLAEFDPITDLAPNSYLTSFYSGNVDGDKLNAMLQVIEKYQLQVKPTKIFSLEELPQAHEFLESNQSFGKVIVMN